MRTTVAIVGAGVAGLAAASRLLRAGVAVKIIEARPRLGGRIDTRHGFADVPIELGAEFVHGRHPALVGLLEEAGLAMDRRVFERLVLREGKDISATHSWESVFEAVADPQARDVPIARVAEELLASGQWSPAQAQMLHRYVEGYMAADAQRVSALALSEEERAGDEIDGHFNSSVRKGYDALVHHLAAGLDEQILLGTSVHRVIWKEGSARLEMRDADGSELAPLQAQRVLVTVPLGILQLNESENGAIRFEPALGVTIDAARRLAMGNVIKLFVRFGGPLSGIVGLDASIASKLAEMTFLQTPDAAIPTWWKIGDANAPILAGWAGGPSADALSSKDEQQIVATAVETLAQAFGTGRDAVAAHITAATVAVWSRDPWARGAYSWIPAGALDAPVLLAAPVASTLFFAGEATDTAGYRGTVHGAIVSGLRAAQEILDLQP